MTASNITSDLHDVLRLMMDTAVNGTVLEGKVWEGEVPDGEQIPYLIFEAIELREDDHITGQSENLEAAVGVQIHVSTSLGRRAARELADHVYEQLGGAISSGLPTGLARVELMGDRMPTISRSNQTWHCAMDLLLFVELS